MTELPDDLFEPQTPPMSMAGRPKCRHPREYQVRLDDGGWRCGVSGCDHIASGAKVRQGRNNKKRGHRIQKTVVEGLGGENILGNKPGHDGRGAMFSYESKSGKAGGVFSEQLWRWNRGIPATADQTRVLIVRESFPPPGVRARAYVVVEYGDWQDLHQEERSDD